MTAEPERRQPRQRRPATHARYRSPEVPSMVGLVQVEDIADDSGLVTLIPVSRPILDGVIDRVCEWLDGAGEPCEVLVSQSLAKMAAPRMAGNSRLVLLDAKQGALSLEERERDLLDAYVRQTFDTLQELLATCAPPEPVAELIVVAEAKKNLRIDALRALTLLRALAAQHMLTIPQESSLIVQHLAKAGRLLGGVNADMLRIELFGPSEDKIHSAYRLGGPLITLRNLLTVDLDGTGRRDSGRQSSGNGIAGQLEQNQDGQSIEDAIILLLNRVHENSLGDAWERITLPRREALLAWFEHVKRLKQLAGVEGKPNLAGFVAGTEWCIRALLSDAESEYEFLHSHLRTTFWKRGAIEAQKIVYWLTALESMRGLLNQRLTSWNLHCARDQVRLDTQRLAREVRRSFTDAVLDEGTVDSERNVQKVVGKVYDFYAKLHEAILSQAEVVASRMQREPEVDAVVVASEFECEVMRKRYSQRGISYRVVAPIC